MGEYVKREVIVLIPSLHASHFTTNINYHGNKES